MKKNYLKLKIMLVAIMLIVLVVGCCVMTYLKAKDIQEEYISEIYMLDNIDANLRMSAAVWMDDETDIIQQVYYEYYKIPRYDDVGFYSMLKDASGNTLAEEQNFILISKYDSEYYLETSDKRVILMGDDSVTEDEGAQISFAIGSFSEVEIKGTCDENHIYLDELNWTDFAGDEHYSYAPHSDAGQSQSTISFEEWAGGSTFTDGLPNNNTFGIYVHTDHHTYGDWEKNKRLNEEAKDICQQVYADYASGVNTLDQQKSEGLFTTYLGRTGYITDDYAIPYIFVFHPVSMAMDELIGIYILVGLFGVLAIVAIWFMVDGVYKKQLSYENNRRELTRGIAHELKTPLAITKGYLENWEYLGETERQESSKTMIAEIAHMDRMVTDLLELSHLEAKAKKLNLESVDLQALARSVVGRMKPIIEEKQLIVSGNIDGEQTDREKYLVEADLEMMRVVLVNLVSNAVKYADKEINISLSENGKRVGFVIANDGQTVAVDNIGKVWDEFYRDETVDAKRIGGSGLGLAITKNVLILHGAKYGCKSEQGRTTFWFEIKR